MGLRVTVWEGETIAHALHRLHRLQRKRDNRAGLKPPYFVKKCWVRRQKKWRAKYTAGVYRIKERRTIYGYDDGLAAFDRL
jgi:hypothetical protein